MSQPPAHLVFDRPLARRRLARALAREAAGFLLDHVAAEFPDRLAAVLRPFPRVLDLGTPGPALAGLLAARGGELFVRAGPLPQSLGGAGLRLVVDEEALPFAPQSFDLVVSALALQGVNDLPGALIQIRRVLRPDGLFLACMAGGQTLQELRLSLAAAEDEVSGGVSPRVSPFADLRDMGGLLQRAGYALPVTDVDVLTVRYDHLFALLRDLRAMGATNVLLSRDRRPLRRRVLVRAAEIYQERFADPDGRVRATFEFLWLSGWAPHESQQKPLQPGSAKARLADALSTVERKL
ncbi:MAG: SAM-dependent methyltransferase [Hyphomicrobiales bacterium]|nr:SAM-dependent methyltransferase [Hyphomicrobiales bacterium]